MCRVSGVYPLSFLKPWQFPHRRCCHRPQSRCRPARRSCCLRRPPGTLAPARCQHPAPRRRPAARPAQTAGCATPCTNDNTMPETHGNAASARANLVCSSSPTGRQTLRPSGQSRWTDTKLWALHVTALTKLCSELRSIQRMYTVPPPEGSVETGAARVLQLPHHSLPLAASACLLPRELHLLRTQPAAAWSIARAVAEHCSRRASISLGPWPVRICIVGQDMPM